MFVVTTTEQINTLVFAQTPSPCMCDGQESQLNNNNIRLCSGYSLASVKLLVQNRIFMTVCGQIKPWLEGFHLTDVFSQLGDSWQGIQGQGAACPVLSVCPGHLLMCRLSHGALPVKCTAPCFTTRFVGAEHSQWGFKKVDLSVSFV